MESRLNAVGKEIKERELKFIREVLIGDEGEDECKVWEQTYLQPI